MIFNCPVCKNIGNHNIGLTHVFRCDCGLVAITFYKLLTVIRIINHNGDSLSGVFGENEPQSFIFRSLLSGTVTVTVSQDKATEIFERFILENSVHYLMSK
jgi:hypothetical protein